MDADLWEEIRTRLRNGETVAVATIATSDGSTPRSAGAKMLAGKAGLLKGTLGGGPAEAMALREAAKTLADGESRLFSVDMGGGAAGGADLICGGVVRIFVQRLESEHADVAEELCDRLAQGVDSLLVTPVRGRPTPALLEGDEEDGVMDAGWNREGARLIERGGAEYLLEIVKAASRLILAGGGHVSLATARIAQVAGFDVTVLDDRDEFANPGRFPWLPPGQAIVVPAFADCFRRETLGYAVDAKCGIAVLTRGHEFDGEVLAQALATPAEYVGMIGSRRKRDIVYDRLRRQGFSDADIGRVHCPIGLAIGAETPEEIAVSIVAELVAVKRRGNGNAP